jgi:general secretion pathway protein J
VSPRARHRGFTLVEVMIAIAITAAMGAMVASAFAGIDKAASLVREQADQAAAARVALSRMAREVSMAYLSENYDRERFRDRPTLFVGREDELLFTTLAHERLVTDAKESDQAVVEYTVDSDPDARGGRALFRREKARIDDEADRGGRRDLVATGVSELRLQYWDPKRKEWVREWSTRSTEHMNELPTRVRLELAVAVPRGEPARYVTEARIAIRQPLDFK